MDKEAEKRRLENERLHIQQYLDHPITKNIFADSASEQENVIELILERPVTNIETFLAREQALGHLRGLRRAKAIVQDSLEEIDEQIQAL